MRPSSLFPGAALSVLAVFLLWGARAQAGQLPAAVEATGTLTPQAALFGDTVVARLDVTVDRRRIDPERVRVASSFSPYTPSGEQIRRQDAGDSAYLRYTIELRCLTKRCAPEGKERFVFPDATVTYPGTGGGRATGSVRVAWPALDVYSRLDQIELARVDPRDVAPWRGDLAALPAVSYGIDPDLLQGLLIAGGILFLLAGAAIALLQLPRRMRAPRRAPAVTMTPLERALFVLDSARTRGAAADRRKALELLATELESGGEPPLAGEARELAWSKSSPGAEAAKTLAARVRRRLEARKNGHDA